ncbi:MAG: hypothetical protein ACREQN_14675 [Candidatus Binataceae bacterium]
MSPNQPASLGAAAVRPFREPVQLQWNRFVGVSIILVVIGVSVFIVGLTQGYATRVWETYLVNLLFFLGVAESGVIASCAFYLTQGRWCGTVHYRLAEAFSGFIPLAFILFWGVFFGRAHIFPWITHPSLLYAPAKHVWLNVPFLFARDGAALLLLTVLSMWFVRKSRGPEAERWAEDGETIEMPPKALRRLAPAIAILYCYVFSMLSVDLIMSLSPVWRSTLFGWWYFAGAFWSAAAAMALAAVFFRRVLGPSNAFTSRKTLHDLGLFVFAFSVFWIYLSFAQYLVIWYGDIPAETYFIVVRAWHQPWSTLTWMAPLLMWAVPFVVLMGVRPKTTPAILGTVAFLGLCGVWILNYILIVPSLFPNQLPFGWIEVGITLGFLGAFGLCSKPGLALVADAATAGMDGGER